MWHYYYYGCLLGHCDIELKCCCCDDYLNINHQEADFFVDGLGVDELAEVVLAGHLHNQTMLMLAWQFSPKEMEVKDIFREVFLLCEMDLALMVILDVLEELKQAVLNLGLD